MSIVWEDVFICGKMFYIQGAISYKFARLIYVTQSSCINRVGGCCYCWTCLLPDTDKVVQNTDSWIILRFEHLCQRKEIWISNMWQELCRCFTFEAIKVSQLTDCLMQPCFQIQACVSNVIYVVQSGRLKLILLEDLVTVEYGCLYKTATDTHKFCRIQTLWMFDLREKLHTERTYETTAFNT